MLLELETSTFPAEKWAKWDQARSAVDT